MRNSAVRRNAHIESNIYIYIVSKMITGKITFYTAIKIIFLMIFSIFQILMLTSILGNVKVVSKIIVDTSSADSSRSDIIL